MSHPITIQVRLSLMGSPFPSTASYLPFDHAEGTGICGRFSTVRRDIASKLNEALLEHGAGDVKDDGKTSLDENEICFHSRVAPMAGHRHARCRPRPL